MHAAYSLFYPLNVEQNIHQSTKFNFTTILNWIEQDGVSYNISVDPLAELVQLMNNTWQVIGNYNMLYNVSIEATLCDMYSKTTNITLEYGKS